MIAGTRIHWVWPEPESEAYRHETVFVSPDLHEKFGQYRIATDECPIPIEADVSDLDTVPHGDLPSDVTAALDAAGVPENEWSEVLFSETLQARMANDNLDILLYSAGPATARVNYVSQLADDEKKLRSSEQNLSTSAGDPEYSGPLFVYRSDRDVDTPDLTTVMEQRGPINTAWRRSLGIQSSAVETRMKNNGWGLGVSSLLPDISLTRYVFVETGSGTQLRSEAGQVGKSTVLTAQYHTRLYDIPDSMDTSFDVAGQAHEDPVDHNHIQNRNWQFAQSRQEVGKDWRSWGHTAPTIPIGNQDGFVSSDGKQDQIGQ